MYQAGKGKKNIRFETLYVQSCALFGEMERHFSEIMKKKALYKLKMFEERPFSLPLLDTPLQTIRALLSGTRKRNKKK